MRLSALDLPLIASLITAAVLAVAGFRSAVSPRARASAATLLACGVLLAQAALYAHFTVDDAFITFRFSRNWASGLGPVFQPGERVEGYTCFLWMALLSVAGRLGIDIELAAKALGIASSLAALVGVRRLVLAIVGDGRAARLAPVLLGLSPLFAAWSPAGMDAPLFAAILAWASAAFVAESRSPRAFPSSALWFGLLVLARPEGILFAAIAWATRLTAAEPRERRIPGSLRWLAACAAIALPYWIWRWAYYGAPLPNTFYAKVAFGLGRVIHGAGSIGDFLAEAGVLQVLLVLLAFSGARWREEGGRFLFLSLGAFLAYVLWTGGDVLHLRFYVHFLPLWIAAAAIGLDRLLDGVAAMAREPGGAVSWAAIALGVVSAGLGYHEHARARPPHDQFGVSYVADNSSNIHRAHMPLGDWLRTHAPPGSRVAATDIGGLGYQSRLPIVDLYGLTDRNIARLIHRRASATELATEVRARNPELIVLYGTSRGPSLGWLANDPGWIAGSYRTHSFWPDSPLDKGLVLLARNDVPLPPAPQRP